MYKYPLAGSLIIEAQSYALASSEYTLDYEGFEQQKQIDLSKKLHRIFIGKLGQLWLCEFCRLNGIKYIKDTSSPLKPDSEDLSINGYSVDVKTSNRPDIWPQVSHNFDNPSSREIDIYCFLLTDPQATFIQPRGLVRKSFFSDKKVKVDVGEVVPETQNMEQRFKHSYFIDPALLKPFGSAMGVLQKQSKSDYLALLALKKKAVAA